MGSDSCENCGAPLESDDGGYCESCLEDANDVENRFREYAAEVSALKASLAQRDETIRALTVRDWTVELGDGKWPLSRRASDQWWHWCSPDGKVDIKSLIMPGQSASNGPTWPAGCSAALRQLEGEVIATNQQKLEESTDAK